MSGARPSAFTLTSSGPLRLYSTTELLNMEPPEWLVEGVFAEETVIGLYGQPKSGKSFIAIDFAMCIATGTPWKGHKVQRGFVLYISAEGGRGIGKRVLAWLTAHNLDLRDADIAWLVEAMPVNVDSDEMGILLERLTIEVQRHPILVVVDTLARCFDGDENLQEDMGRFIAGVDLLRHEFGSAVMVVHHTSVSGQRERGSSALRGAADTMMFVEKDGTSVTLSCTAQKDDEEFEAVELELLPVEETRSCVLIEAQSISRREEMVGRMVRVLEALGPCSWDTWIDALNREGIPKGQWFKYQTAIKERAHKGKDRLWRPVE